MNTSPNHLHALPEEVRNWAMACHLFALVGMLGNGIGYLFGPLITWLIKRNDHPFIDEHGKEAVNFQLTMFLALLCCVPLVFIIIGIPMMILIGLIMTILPIVAGIKAANGEHYQYPLSFRFLQ